MIPKDHVFPGFFANLTNAEALELQIINRRVSNWVSHCEKVKKEQFRDLSLCPTNEMYYRREELRNKLFEPRKPIQLDDVAETNGVSLLSVNFGK